MSQKEIDIVQQVDDAKLTPDSQRFFNNGLVVESKG